MSVSLTDGESVLVESVLPFLRRHFTNPPIRLGQPYRNDFPWTPPIQLNTTHHRKVFIQPSEEKVYPAIMSMSHGDLMALTDPIIVYSLCPAEIANRQDQQKDIERLRNHGYGLIVVNVDASCDIRLDAGPLIQFIAPDHIETGIEGLPVPVKRLLKSAYHIYRQNPIMGVKEICDLTEGFVLKAGQDAVRKGWIPASSAQPGRSAQTLDAFTGSQNMNQANGSIGGMRAYIQTHRNNNAHYPKNKTQAVAKYRGCRHAFMEGIERIKYFSQQMKAVGLSGKVETH